MKHDKLNNRRVIVMQDLRRLRAKEDAARKFTAAVEHYNTIKLVSSVDFATDMAKFK